MQQGSAECVEGLPNPSPDHLDQSSCHLEFLKRPLFRVFFFKSASSGFQSTSETTQSLVKALKRVLESQTKDSVASERSVSSAGSDVSLPHLRGTSCPALARISMCGASTGTPS